MTPPRVVNVRRDRTFGTRPGEVYIGRRHPRFPQGSPWGNPFRARRENLSDPGYADFILGRYEDYVRKSPALLTALPSLAGCVLGCWCVDERGEGPCHGQVLVRLFEEVCR